MDIINYTTISPTTYKSNINNRKPKYVVIICISIICIICIVCIIYSIYEYYFEYIKRTNNKPYKIEFININVENIEKDIDNCSICLEELTGDVCNLNKCSHKFHKLCFEQLQKYKIIHCPLCNQHFYIESIV